MINTAVKAGHINMGRLLRQMSRHTNQSRKMVYHRPPVFGKDNYGVETTSQSTAEIVLPELPCLIRPAMTADYALERAGVNIIGGARIYTPNIKNIKGFANFNQNNNPDFNEIEGWDRFIDKQRTVYTVPTTGTTHWATTTGSITADGESITLTASGNTTLYFTGSHNTLEADRLRFQIKGSGSVVLADTIIRHRTDTSAYNLKYDNSDITLNDNKWLTVDLPFTTGSAVSGTSIYQSGARYAVSITSGASWGPIDYTKDFKRFSISCSADAGDTIMVKGIEYYKSISWHVHSLKEYNDDYMNFTCVRTRGKRDSRRRAYGAAYSGGAT